MTANRGSWKHVERETAALLGGERVPVTGRARGSAPDVEHPWLAVEVKTTKRLPALIVKAMAQADASAEFCRRRTGKRKMPVVVIHQDRTPYGWSVVSLRLQDFRLLIGDEPSGYEVV